MKNIVIVDDTANQLVFLELIINQCGFVPIKFSNPSKALEYIKTNKIDLLITDYNMPEMDGIELIREVKKIASNIKTSVVSAFEDEKGTLQSDCDSLDSPLLRKPFDLFAFEDFFKSICKEDKRNIFCIKHIDKLCDKRDKVTQKYCMSCSLDDQEDYKEVI